MLNVLRWPAAGKARYLIVMCHGYAADASQMEVFVDAWARHLPHAAFLAPDAPDPFEEFPLGHQWFSLRDRTPAVLDALARRAAPKLGAAIDAECTRLGIAPDRVAIAGFSQGAMMALHTGLRRTPPPAAILAYAGAMLDTPALERELTGHPPTLLVHGESDAVVPFDRGPHAAAALRRLGVPVETAWLPGVEHVVDPAGLSAGLAFLRLVLPHTEQ